MQKRTSFERDVTRRLARIECLLNFQRKEAIKMSKELDDLTTSVANEVTVEESALTLIQGIAAQLAAAQTDPAKLTALKEQLDSEATKLAAAVAANTPATPAPTPAPTPAQRPLTGKRGNQRGNKGSKR